MILSPRVLRTTCRGGVLAWRLSSCSPFVPLADGESPTLSVFLFPPCIPPFVASVPTLDRCHVGFELLSMTALAMGLFARRPPLVVPRSRCQPPPLKPP
ncbi:hypothetical protein HID58_069563 [Brassica napus]|uniref:Secreted protein n=2 Tax=Brassica napus TaxID=3708 RepID=A0ABQ7YWC7_BRANA|nr:hypothetical protein HID58_069563 [Brassica napus]